MQNKYKILVSLFLLILNLTNSFSQELSSCIEFRYKNEIAPYNSFKKLLNNPTEIGSHINQIVDNNSKLLDTLFDFHAIFDIPINNLAENLIDLENEQNVFPRMIYSKDLNPAHPLWSHRLQEIKTQFSMGKLEKTYHYILYKVPEINNDGSILIKWNLYDSIDENFEFSYGSWFLKEIFFEGKKYTYVRNFVHYGMKNYPAYVFIAMKLGGKNDSKGFLKSLMEASR